MSEVDAKASGMNAHYVDGQWEETLKKKAVTKKAVKKRVLQKKKAAEKKKQLIVF